MGTLVIGGSLLKTNCDFAHVRLVNVESKFNLTLNAGSDRLKRDQIGISIRILLF